MAWKLEHIPRGSNEKANALVAVAASLLTKETMLFPIYYHASNQVNEIEEAYPFWMTPIVRYLSSGELPDSRVEAHKIQVQAT